jgi:hypothetical protein
MRASMEKGAWVRCLEVAATRPGLLTVSCCFLFFFFISFFYIFISHLLISLACADIWRWKSLAAMMMTVRP